MAAKKLSVLWNVASAGVFFVIKRATDNYYWNGTGWQASATTVSSTEAATLDTTTPWIEYYTTTSPSAYCFWWAYTSGSQMINSGEFDPEVGSTTYTLTDTLKRFSVTHYVSGDGVYFVIRRASDNFYWNGSSWQAAQTTISSTEVATLDSNRFEYYSTTAPDEYCFWWAYNSSDTMLRSGDYMPPSTQVSLPSFTSGKLIKRAMRLIGILAAGETPNADDYADALLAFQMMLDSWSADSTLPPVPTEVSHTLTAGTADYTIGPTGDIERTRPTDIFNMNIRDGSTDYWAWPMGRDEYYRIGDKTLETRPTKYLFEPGATNAKIRLNAEPDQAYTMYLYLLDPFTPPVDINEGISYPPGYIEAMVYNLGVRLAPEYGLTPRQDILSGAESMLNNIRNRYVQIPEMVTGFERGEYDINSDSYQ